MKKQIIILFAAVGNLYASKSTMITSGLIDDVGNWTVSPYSVDTLVVPAGKVAGFNLSVLTNVKNISVYGTLTPNTSNSGGADHLTINSAATIDIYTGGKVTNLKGNNSNHSISFGTVCVWGKKCCSGNHTIIGYSQITANNPCNPIVLAIRHDNNKYVPTYPKDEISDKNGSICVYMTDAEYLDIAVVDLYTGRVKRQHYIGSGVRFEISGAVFVSVTDNNGRTLQQKFVKFF